MERASQCLASPNVGRFSLKKGLQCICWWDRGPRCGARAGQRLSYEEGKAWPCRVGYNMYRGGCSCRSAPSERTGCSTPSKHGWHLLDLLGWGSISYDIIWYATLPQALLLYLALLAYSVCVTTGETLILLLSIKVTKIASQTQIFH